MIPLHDDNPTSTRPLVTLGLIVVCMLAFLWELGLNERELKAAVFAFGAVPAKLSAAMHLPSGHLSAALSRLPAWLSVFTSMFLHGGWLHLIGNMLYLWIFGNNVEDAMGHRRFIFFYASCGLAAAAAQALSSPDSLVPMIGASGAISGVLGAYLLLFPHSRVLVLIPLGILLPIIRLPAILVLGFWFLLQLLNSVLPNGEDGIAFSAHVGGFVAGLVLIPFFKRSRVPLLAARRRH